ncbi:radical SAM protein, partial [bacterium]|nr:radical SAM protein [bacterium]
SCVYCQNYDLSHDLDGLEISPSCLSAQMLALQMAGCHNLNLVSPTHVVPQILDALTLAVEQGFHLPIVYNTGGYDSMDALRLLDGIVDVYMPDFKYFDEETALQYSSARDYPLVVKEALREMHRQVGDLQTDENGLAVRGLLIRHLVLPEGLAGTASAMKFIAEEISPNTAVNIMGQYRPAGEACLHPKIDRAVTLTELMEAKRLAQDAGLTRIL